MPLQLSRLTRRVIQTVDVRRGGSSIIINSIEPEYTSDLKIGVPLDTFGHMIMVDSLG